MTNKNSMITFKQYRFMDLAFFAVIGIFCTLISEGLLLAMPDAGFYLSLVLLVGFLLQVRWGIVGIIPYFLALVTAIFFHSRYTGWQYYLPFYVVQAVGFFIPVIFVRKYYNKNFAQGLFTAIVVFSLSFVTQAIAATLYIYLIEDGPILATLGNYLGSQLLNFTLSTLFIVLLYKFSRTLFNDVKLYLLKAQEEEDGSTE